MSKKAAANRAEKTGTNQDAIDLEWDMLRSLKALQEDASRAATMKKQKVQHLKDIKNQQLVETSALFSKCAKKQWYAHLPSLGISTTLSSKMFTA